MNSQTQDRMASDLHTIAAPFRFIGGMLQILALMVIVPLALIGVVVYWLVTGHQVMRPDELSFLTAGIKLALILSPVWLPFMFIGPHVRKVGFYCLMGLALFFSFIQLDPHYVDHEFCLTMGQLATMMFLPLAILLVISAIKRMANRPEPTEIDKTLQRMKEERFPEGHPLVGKKVYSVSQNKLVRVMERWEQTDPQAAAAFYDKQRLEAEQRVS